MIYEEEKLDVTETTEEKVEQEVAPVETTEQEVVDAPKDKKKKEKKPKSKARKIIEWVLLGIFIAFFGFVAAGTIDGMIHKKENNDESLRFGVGTFVVLTDSMEPLYKKQTALITYKESMSVVESNLKNYNHEVYETADETIYTFAKESSLDITFKNNQTGISPSSFNFRTPEYVTGQLVETGMVMTHRIRELHVYKNKNLGEGKYVFVTSGINNEGDYSKQGQYQFVTEKLYLGTVKLNSPFLGAVFGFISSIWGLLILLLIPAAYLIIVSAKDIFKALKESEEENATSKEVSGLETLSKEDQERLKRELLDEMIAEKTKEKENKDEN